MMTCILSHRHALAFHLNLLLPGKRKHANGLKHQTQPQMGGDASRVGVFFSSLVPRENAKFNPLLLSVGKRRHFAYETLHKKRENIKYILSLLSERGDSNARPLRPERSALPTALLSDFGSAKVGTFCEISKR